VSLSNDLPGKYWGSTVNWAMATSFRLLLSFVHYSTVHFYVHVECDPRDSIVIQITLSAP